MSKITFKSENKHISGFPLKKIETIGLFQGLDQNNVTVPKGNDYVEELYNKLDIILASRKGARMGNPLKGEDIKNIYVRLFNKKPIGGKDKIIDEIVNYVTTVKYENTKDFSTDTIKIEDDIEEDDYDDDDVDI